MSLSLCAERLFSNKEAVACVDNPAKKLCLSTNKADKYCCERNEFNNNCGEAYNGVCSDRLEPLGGNAKYLLASFANDCGTYFYYVNPSNSSSPPLYTEIRTIPQGQSCIFRIRNDNWDSHSLKFQLGTQINVDVYVYELKGEPHDYDENSFEVRGELLPYGRYEDEISIEAFKFAYVVVTPSNNNGDLDTAGDGIFGTIVSSVDENVDPYDPDDYHGMAIGAILGIVFGSLIFVILMLSILICICKKCRSKPSQRCPQEEARYRMITEESPHNLQINTAPPPRPHPQNVQYGIQNPYPQQIPTGHPIQPPQPSTGMVTYPSSYHPAAPIKSSKA
ncbi:unnamed protein product [Moneuplotes crassus]|uniref:Uncharacterized protein n=1 Tax=Euplotes crassus TaxID=5936 RepID=A0AAD1XHZ8_EUPCR|nr:unnamed protein product [Moneuplotes crassus]